MTSPSKTAAMLLCALGSLSLSSVANAQDLPWLVRVRAVDLVSANKDTTGLDLSINDKIIPEVDVSYHFTPNWAVELVLTYPQKQKLRSGGADIGTFKHLPPTLTAQYHFAPVGSVSPYLGAGVNYTRISNVSFSPAVQAALSPSVSHSSFGLAAQAGFDWEFAKNTVFNVDIKKMQIRADVKSASTKVGEFKIDPWLIGVGIGWRF